MKQALAGFLIAAFALALAAYVLWLLTGCSTPRRQDNPHPPSPVTIDQFRAFQPVHPPLPERLLAPASMEEVLPLVVLGRPVEVPSLVLTSTPPKLKWQARPGAYRVLVSNDGGLTWLKDSDTAVWPREGWDEWGIEVLKPTNLLFKVVSP